MMKLKFFSIIYFVFFIISCSTYKSDNISDTEFYELSYYMAHAFGAINGDTYTNSKEAFYNAIKRGYKLLEVDLSLSKEGIPVCRHYQWNEFSYSEFMNGKILDKYTPVDIDFLIDRILNTPNLYFDLDIYADKKQIIDYLVTSTHWNVVSETQKKKFLEHFIVECYGIAGYEEIYSVYPDFKYYMLLLSTFKNDEETHNRYISFMKEHSLKLVIMSYTWLSDELVSMYKKNGINIYCFTVNKDEDYKICKKYGVIGIQTDNLFRN